MLKTEIEHAGQPYIDQPIYKDIKPLAEFRSPIAQSICTELPKTIQVVERYERTRLRWMQPDGKGGLVPKRGRR